MTVFEIGVGLESCNDNCFAIENGILLPSLRPMLPLLDMHDIRRLDFHNSVMEELREKLLNQIAELGEKDDPDKEKRLRELLKKSFPVVKVKQLRPVVLSVLKQLNHIEDKYLKVLVKDRELYNECDTVVKRQIWKDNQALFGEEVTPVFSQYIKEKEEVLFNIENLTNSFFSPSPKIRRQAPIVQKLANMIGNNIKLYDMVLQFLRTLFMRSQNWHYCTLRSELLMALHDLEVHDIMSVDPCHKFTWCIDACLREKQVDAKRSRELQLFLDGIKKGQEQILGDISMVLGDPHVIFFLASFCLKICNNLINSETVPRDNTVLVLLLRLMALGLGSWQIISSQEFKEPRLEPSVVTKFVPALMSLIVDDQARALSVKLPPDERQTALTVIEHSGPVPDAYTTYIYENDVAYTLAMYYTMQTAKQKDKVGLMRVVGALARSDTDRAFEDPFLHTLVGALISFGDEFVNEDFCTVVFDEFFSTAIARENVCRHVLKLVWYVYPKLPVQRVGNLLKAMTLTLTINLSARRALSELQEKVRSHTATIEAELSVEKPLSPLAGIATPSHI
nr:EOG090X0363 [Artemia franciscana]